MPGCIVQINTLLEWEVVMSDAGEGNLAFDFRLACSLDSANFVASSVVDQNSVDKLQEQTDYCIALCRL